MDSCLSFLLAPRVKDGALDACECGLEEFGTVQDTCFKVGVLGVSAPPLKVIIAGHGMGPEDPEEGRELSVVRQGRLSPSDIFSKNSPSSSMHKVTSLTISSSGGDFPVAWHSTDCCTVLAVGDGVTCDITNEGMN